MFRQKKSKIILKSGNAIVTDSSPDIEFGYNDGKSVAIYYSSDSSDIKNDNQDKKSASKKKKSGSTDNKKVNKNKKSDSSDNKKSDSQNNMHADVEVENSISMN